MNKNLFKILYIVPIFNVITLFVFAYRYIFWGIEKNSEQVILLILITIISIPVCIFIQEFKN